jgi:hypothetical protein
MFGDPRSIVVGHKPKLVVFWWLVVRHTTFPRRSGTRNDTKLRDILHRNCGEESNSHEEEHVARITAPTCSTQGGLAKHHPPIPTSRAGGLHLRPTHPTRY